VKDRTGTPWAPRVATFLVAEAISAIGSFGTMIAIWAYAAYKYDATPAQISLYGVAFALPGVIFGPVSGLIVDRLGSKPVLLYAKLLGVAASIALLFANDFAMLTLLSALHGVGAAFARPALTSMPPRMVDDDNLARTNALVGLTEQLSIVLGPVAAGVSIGLFGFKGAFVFDGFTYALGIFVLPLVPLRAVDPASLDHVEVATSPWREAIAGWKVVLQRPLARRVVITSFVIHLLYGTSMLAEPLYVRDVLHRSTTVFASLQTVFGVLLVAGGILAAHVGDRMATFRWVVAGLVGSGITASIYLGTSSLVVAFVGVSLWGACTALIWGPAHTVLQRATPEAAHGRVMAADQLAQNFAMFCGLGLAGVAIGAVGVRSTVAALSVFVIGAGIALGLSDARSRVEGPASSTTERPISEEATPDTMGV
jgi:MFS family permease